MKNDKKYLLLFATVLILINCFLVHASLIDDVRCYFGDCPVVYDDNNNLVSDSPMTLNASILVIDGGWSVTQQSKDVQNPILYPTDTDGNIKSGNSLLHLIQSPKNNDQFTLDDIQYTYNDAKRIEYDFDWGQTNFYLYDSDGNQPDEIYGNATENGTFKFGAVDSSNEGLKNYTYFINSTDELIELENEFNGYHYPIFYNYHYSDTPFENETQHRYDFRDICSKSYSNCQWSLSDDQLSATLTFTSNGNIDPLADPVTNCGTISSSGYYHLANNLDGSSGCIVISADNVILNGSNHNIRFDEDGKSGKKGIEISATVHNNITIEDFSTVYSVDFNDNDDALYVDSYLSNSNIHDNTLGYPTEAGGARYGIYMTGNSTNNNILNNGFQTYSNSIYLGQKSSNDIFSRNWHNDGGGIYHPLPSFYLVSNATNMTLSNQNIDSYSFNAIGNVSFINSTYGEIDLFNFNAVGSHLIGSSSSDVIIKNDFAFINQSKFGLNQNSTITLYGLTFIVPAVLRNGIIVFPPVYSTITNVSHDYTINDVLYSGNYSLYESYVPHLTSVFYDYSDDSGTLTDNGTGNFKVRVNNSNGTVILMINSHNVTAVNTTNEFNATYNFTTGGNYSYQWFSYDAYPYSSYHNVSDVRYYFVYTTPPIIPPTSPITMYDILNSSGAGLGIFILYMARAIPLLLLSLALVVIFVAIGYGIAFIIKKSSKNFERGKK